MSQAELRLVSNSSSLETLGKPRLRNDGYLVEQVCAPVAGTYVLKRDDIDTLAEQTAKVTQENNSGLNELMETLERNLQQRDKNGLRDRQLIETVTACRKTYEQEQSPVVVIPLLPVSTKFRNEVIQSRVSALNALQITLIENEAKRSNERQLAEACGIKLTEDTTWVKDLYDVVGEVYTPDQAFAMNIEKISQERDSIIETYLSQFPHAQTIIQIIALTQENNATSNADDISILDGGKLREPFKGTADIRGASLVSLIERLHDINLPNDPFVMQPYVAAMMCEMVLETASEVTSTQPMPPYGKIRRRDVFAIMPYNINSREIKQILSTPGSEKIFPKLHQLDKEMKEQKTQSGLWRKFRR